MSRENISSNYTIRLPQVIREQLTRLSLEKSESIGKYVAMSDILLAALEYGLPVVEAELKHHIPMPSKLRSKSEQLAHMAVELVRRGLELSFPESEVAPGAAA